MIKVNEKLIGNGSITLLENLCKVNGAQGGTIHQYLDVMSPGYQGFIDALEKDFLSYGGFVSFDTLNYYAKKYKISIKWSEDTLKFHKKIGCAWCDYTGYIKDYDDRFACGHCNDGEAY